MYIHNFGSPEKNFCVINLSKNGHLQMLPKFGELRYVMICFCDRSSENFYWRNVIQQIKMVSNRIE